MRRNRRTRTSVALAGLTAACAVVSTVLGTPNALAYGKADNPIAQVEISLNCNNATLCPHRDVAAVRLAVGCLHRAAGR